MNSNSIGTRFLRTSAALGALVTLLYALLSPSTRTVVTHHVYELLLVAPLVIVPLGLALAGATGPTGRRSGLFRPLAYMQLPAALLLVCSLLFRPGVAAGVLALPWLLVTVLMALHGAWRLLRRQVFLPDGLTVDELAIDVGLIYIAVGGIWLVAARFGVALLGFPPIVVALTAAHFHFAGFTVSIVAGLAGKVLPRRPRRRWRIYRAAAVVATGTPILIAFGILVSPLMEMVCAFALAIALGALAVLMLASIAPLLRSILARVLLSVSALSLFVTMTLACLFAIGEFTGDHRIVTVLSTSIPHMVETHGLINVLGFAVCGLLALLIEHDRSAVAT